MVKFDMHRAHVLHPRSLFTLVCALFAVSLSACVRGQVVVQPEASPLASTFQAWCDSHVPAPYRSRDRVVVRLMDNDAMTAYLRGDSDGRQTHQADTPGDTDDIDGVFEDGPPRIGLRMPDDGKPDMFTFAHEYGHYVWFHVLSRDDRKRYEALYNHQRGSHHLVTQYASTSVQEGFAEAFSFYVVQPAILSHRDPASGAFFTQFTQTHSGSTPS